MCRLLGVVSASPALVRDQVPEEVQRLDDLSGLHGHGWGIATIAGGGTTVVDKAPERAAASSRWRDVVAGIRTDASVLHIRQASPGMPHTVANTHPFHADGMAFAHNGHAEPAEALDALIRSADGPPALGDTDSERYFSLVRTAARDASLDRALLDAASRIASAATATSLNALLLTQDGLVAIAWWHEPTIRDAGYGETDRDYRLWYRVSPDRVVVASAFVAGDGPEWQELPHGHALTVERGSLEVRVTVAQGTRAPA